MSLHSNEPLSLSVSYVPFWESIRSRVRLLLGPWWNSDAIVREKLCIRSCWMYWRRSEVIRLMVVFRYSLSSVSSIYIVFSVDRPISISISLSQPDYAISLSALLIVIFLSLSALSIDISLCSQKRHVFPENDVNRRGVSKRLDHPRQRCLRSSLVIGDPRNRVLTKA